MTDKEFTLKLKNWSKTILDSAILMSTLPSIPFENSSQEHSHYNAWPSRSFLLHTS